MQVRKSREHAFLFKRARWPTVEMGSLQKMEAVKETKEWSLKKKNRANFIIKRDLFSVLDLTLVGCSC